MENFRNDIFAPDVSFSLEETKEGEVDGKNILAKVSGNFFVPNGVSRNKRFYPKEVWEKQLSNGGVKTKLKERRMFGMLGHEEKLDA